MNNKKLLVILVIVVVVAIVVAGVLMFMTKKQEVPVNNLNSAGNISSGGQLPSGGENGNNNQPVNNNTNINKPVADPAEQEKSDAINMAKFFVEMLGSYSFGTQFQNVIDAQPMMTASMVAWSNDFMTRNLANLEGSQEKITTKVMQVESAVVDGSSARIVLVARRSRVDNTGESNFSQSAEVTLVKVGGVWKIDNLVWK